MIHSILFTSASEKKTDLSLEEIKSALAIPDNLLWVSLENTNEAETKRVLDDIFHIHPLAIEDSLTSGYQTSKVDDFGSYLFIIANAIKTGNDFRDLETNELNLFLGDNFLVTSFLSDSMPPVQKVFQRLNRDERLLSN